MRNKELTRANRSLDDALSRLTIMMDEHISIAQAVLLIEDAKDAIETEHDRQKNISRAALIEHHFDEPDVDDSIEHAFEELDINPNQWERQ